MTKQVSSNHISVSVENIGGINSTDVEFESGVTVLSGENATNRTSLLQAIAATLGSSQVTLKGDTSYGHAKVRWNGGTYWRNITREDRTLRFDGSPLLTGDQAEVADLFSVLFERNEARQAVEQERDLREVVMDPVDTDEIQREMSDLTAEKRELEQKLSETESLPDDITSLKDRKESIESEIEQKKRTLSETKAEIEETDIEIGESKQQQSEIEDKLDTLREKQTELDRVRSDIESANETIDTLKDQRQEYEEKLESLTTDPSNISELEAEIDELHSRLRQKESTMNEVQNLIQFNQNMLDENVVNEDVFAALRVGAETESESVTAQLQESEEVVCWTCGNRTEKDRISETAARLRDVHEDLYGERIQLQDRIEELEKKKEKFETVKQTREDITQQLQNINEKISQNSERIDTLESRVDELIPEIESLESEIRGLRQDHDNHVLDLHERANHLEYELSDLREERSGIDDEIEDKQQQLAQREEHQSRINEIEERLGTLQHLVEDLEQETVERFNEHMDAILEILEYDNIERIWLERKEVERQEGRRKVQKRIFDLHLIRKNEQGTAYEDQLAHLSESEREVTGLIFALAGNLAHGVYEDVPFLILDSLEAIDSNRIALLIEYLSEIIDNIVVALLSEDAQAVSAGTKITEI